MIAMKVKNFLKYLILSSLSKRRTRLRILRDYAISTYDKNY